MIEPPTIELSLFQKLMLLGLFVFWGAIMFNIHRIIDWIREMDNE